MGQNRRGIILHISISFIIATLLFLAIKANQSRNFDTRSKAAENSFQAIPAGGISGETTQSTEEDHISTDLADTAGSSAVSAAAFEGTKKVLLIVWNFASDAINPFTPLNSSLPGQLADTALYELKPYYDAVSYGKVNVQFTVHSQIITGASPYCGSLSADQTITRGLDVAISKGINLTGYENVVFVVPDLACHTQNGNSTSGKITYRGNTLGVAWVNGANFPGEWFKHTVIHEMGHSWASLGHSQALDCGANSMVSPSKCTVLENSDYHDMMGAAQWVSQFDALRKLQLGWIPAAAVKTVTSGGDYSITALKNAYVSTPMALKIPRGDGNYYMLESRLFSTHDRNISGNMQTGVYVYLVIGGNPYAIDMTPNSNANKYLDFKFDAALDKGKTFRDYEKGIEITVLSKDVVSGTANIRVAFGPPSGNLELMEPRDGYIYRIGDPELKFGWSPLGVDMNSKYQLEINTVAQRSATSKFPGYFRCGSVCSTVTCNLCFYPLLQEPYNFSATNDFVDLYWRVVAKRTNGTLVSSAWRKLYVRPCQVNCNVTPTRPPPTRTPTPGNSVQLLKNGTFEADANLDKSPDNWTINPYFLRVTGNKHSGQASGRHYSLANVNYNVQQVVNNIIAGRSHTLSGWVYIPATTDAFTLNIQLYWRNGTTVIGTPVVVKQYKAATAWNKFQVTKTAPTGANNAIVRMNVQSLGSYIFVDDFSFVRN